jgi:hypothetical protein
MSTPLSSLSDRLDHLQRFLPYHLTDKILANRGRLEGERKLVTVLFADIAGYTALSERVEDETLSPRPAPPTAPRRPRMPCATACGTARAHFHGACLVQSLYDYL